MRILICRCDLCGKASRQPPAAKDTSASVYRHWFRHHMRTKHPEVKNMPRMREVTR